MKIIKTFLFDAAHNLPGYKGKCKELHGHTYKLEVGVEGKINKKTGMVFDFAELSKIVKEEVVEVYDHKYLNDFFSNPTAEIMVEVIFKSLKKLIPGICLVRLWETPTSYAELTTESM